MDPVFPRWTNSVARASLWGVAGGTVVVTAVLLAIVRSPLETRLGVTVRQPVDFDHRHHVRDDGIPCLYCHADAEVSRYAGIPATEVCMGCHGQVRREADLLSPVRESAATGVPIAWKRVYVLPDFVFFDHASHVVNGIGCETCHGDVGGMAVVTRQSTLTMQWCTGCHGEHGAPTDCTTCHR